jgi:hypothetical protein
MSYLLLTQVLGMMRYAVASKSLYTIYLLLQECLVIAIPLFVMCLLSSHHPNTCMNDDGEVVFEAIIPSYIVVGG